jgi:hypothetical protein
VSVFEPVMLPTSIKEQLCRELLEEFGAVAIRHRPGQAELTHGCLVSPEQHSDQIRNPTASLNYDKLTYKCLGCNAQGGILWLISTVRSCTYEEARAWLGRETGTGGTVMPLQQLLDYYDALYASAKVQPTVIPTYPEAVLEPWLQIVHPWLTTGVPDLGITGRGIPEQTVKDLKLGWDPSDDRIVIPHFWKGSLVGWQKRRLSGGGPKYLSTENMPKDVTIFDYDPKRKEAIICEAPLSVARHRHELPMEGTFGANVTDRQVKLISSHYQRIVLWLDSDPGGWKALEGSRNTPGLIDRLSKYAPVWIVDSPFTGGPDDVDTKVAAALVDAAIPSSIWRRPNPDFLSCPRCQRRRHEGSCDPE